ncbi:hypothetical protein DL96DRAFT_1701749 [Flagelloscypha sp. PMI_526]|nr:hypothetical protein DL96DRAFT_1701749 [Flagelloscypha sp. PMI_526]
MSYPCLVELPAELWTQILTYLSSDEIVRLKGLNRTFWHAAMDISYGTLNLAPFKEVPKSPIPVRFLWLSQLRKKARRFKQPYAAEWVRTVHVVPNMEYTVWCRPGLFDRINPMATSLTILFIEIFIDFCLWPFQWVTKNIIPWPIAFLKPTFWLSLASSYELASMLACLHRVETLHLEEILYSHDFYQPNKSSYYLKEPIPSFGPSLILRTLECFAPTIVHLKLTLGQRGIPGFPCPFPALKFLEVVFYFLDASAFIPQVKSSLQSSMLLEMLSLQNRGKVSPPVWEHPLPCHVQFSFFRVLKLDIQPHYTVQDHRTAQNVSELISQYRTQLEELEVRLYGSIRSQASLDDPQRHLFSDSFCVLPKLDVLRRLSINFLDVRPWEPDGGGWFDRFMSNLDRSPMDVLTHLSIHIAQIVHPHSQLALLPNLETFQLKASNLSVNLFASLPTRLPKLRKFQIYSQGKIVSGSSPDVFIENHQLDKLQILFEELDRMINKNNYLNTGESQLEFAEIWLAPETHVNLRPVPGPYQTHGQLKPVHMDDLVRVFADHIPTLRLHTLSYPLGPQ